MTQTNVPGTNRIAAVFDARSSAGQLAFMPFITAGDPDVPTFVQLVRTLGAAGADFIEIGFPYSDPIADGPVIQSSYTRVLESGTRLKDYLAAVRDLETATLPPLLAMVSYAIVLRRGPQAFLGQLAEVGFSGLIVPDLPGDEAQELVQLADATGLALVQLVAPTTPERRVQQIVRNARGFLYCVSVAGTTGERDRLPDSLRSKLKELREHTRLPLAVGFGIRSPEQIDFLRGVADGVIVGSAIVRRVAELANADPQGRAELLQRIGEYVRGMATAAHALAAR
ncbi:MAG: tryptophan synthase subunit alpha [Planctomycetota bacterium]|nr:MAG: tryptophan synthase subunit alpha [Planctomycetota bacterium]